ncbi:MAG: hypothetical protein BWZ10_00202 [candidate division BRC1 bacterium ADurb.BinA364]|nr:MAG: hypothetical protein BWZ10_00202 [candidate division BRC1 bacterium ADurb.BinA364]
MSYLGSKLILVSRRKGRELEIHAEPGDPRMPEFLAPLSHMLERSFRPETRIVVETINGEPAPRSPYLDDLRRAFDAAADYKAVTLYRKTNATGNVQ